jgi:hypothetical protein
MDNFLYEFAVAQGKLPIFVVYRDARVGINIEQFAVAVNEEPDDLWLPAASDDKKLIKVSGDDTRFLAESLVRQIIRSKYGAQALPQLIANLQTAMEHVGKAGRLADSMLAMLNLRATMVPSMTVYEYLEKQYGGDYGGTLPETKSPFEIAFENFVIALCSDRGIPVGESEEQGTIWYLFDSKILEVAEMLFPDYELTANDY